MGVTAAVTHPIDVEDAIEERLAIIDDDRTSPLSEHIRRGLDRLAKSYPLWPPVRRAGGRRPPRQHYPRKPPPAVDSEMGQSD
jgi:hypothetical protein